MNRVRGKKYKTISGAFTENVCAMCFSYAHNSALTVQQMKKHKCLKRGCDRFEPFKDHPYWKQRKLKHFRTLGL